MWTHTHTLLSAKSKNTTPSEAFWRPREVLISLWSLLISVLVCFTLDAVTSASPSPFLPFILSFTHFSTSFPPLYHSNPQAPPCWHQTAAPSVNKCRCVCMSILYPVKERECVCLRNICWAQLKTLMCMGEGVINKYHKWLLCVPIVPRRCVENGASVSFYRADIETSWGPQIWWDFYEDSQTTFMCHRSLKFITQSMYLLSAMHFHLFQWQLLGWNMWLEIWGINIMWLITLEPQDHDNTDWLKAKLDY